MTDTITLPREVAKRILRNIEIGNKLSAGIEMRREIEAALEQPQDHPEQNLNMVPAGWKLVPTEPTPNMDEAAKHISVCREDVYRAMLDAAPQPPVVEQPQGEQEPVAWDEEIIEFLHAHYDTKMIKELDSGDALIRLDDAIAAVEEVAQRYTHPQPKREPLTVGQINRLIADGKLPLSGNPYEVARAIERAHGIGGDA